MTIRELEKMTDAELYKIQENSIKILKAFNIDYVSDARYQRLSDAVDMAQDHKEVNEAFIVLTSFLLDLAEETFYENKKITIHDLAKLV